MRRNLLAVIPTFWIPAYEGEENNPPTPPTPPVPPIPPTPPTPPGDKKFTQEDVNRLLAAEKRKAKEDGEKLVRQLEALQQNTALTQQEKDELQNQIETLRSTYQTHEERAKQTYQELKDKYDKDTKKLNDESSAWKTRFEAKMKGVDILSAANEFKAFNPGQLEKILSPDTMLREKVDAEGKPTGEFETVVNFNDIGKDGQPVKLILSVRDAVKKMTEKPELYGNLFKNDSNGGLNGNNNGRPPGTGSIPDLDTMSPEQYAKNRPAILSEMQRQDRK